ncbi:hypothetical protein GO308_09710 [Sphingomonas sp. SFZ2018-12]|uniref:hypothetical protein n=1 Tax=Sphingomonas sp. SFZ2018-12 TaxID=2683197 RepID=UPI001F0D4D5D|nr:hypothetical protein [Sphingomonas sp. SFZ2018-12]MCH4893384.1 hypothetical protein [Sphingomonas sp. SFZ2018-12]
MPRYIVLTSMPTRDGLLPPGELVELEADEADYLLSVNAIAVPAAPETPVAVEPVPPPARATKAPRAKAKPKPE